MPTKITNKEQFPRQIKTETSNIKQGLGSAPELPQADKNLIREQNNLLGSLRRLNLLNQSGKLNPETSHMSNPKNNDTSK